VTEAVASLLAGQRAGEMSVGKTVGRIREAGDPAIFNRPVRGGRSGGQRQPRPASLRHPVAVKDNRGQGLWPLPLEQCRSVSARV